MRSLSGLAMFDLVAAVLLLSFALYGAFRGMARLVIGAIGLAAAWVIATRYSEPLAMRWGARAGLAEATAPDALRLTAFFLLFAAVVVAAGIAGWLAARLLGAVMLGGLDRLLGAGLGILVGILLVCALTVPLLAMLPPDGGPSMKGSVLAPYAIAGGEWIAAAAPDGMRRRFSEVSGALLSATLEPRPASPKGPPASGKPPAVNVPKAVPSPRPR